MKKLLLTALVMVMGVMNASAWNYLKGTFNSWNASADYCLDNGPVAVYLEASNTAYQFKIDGGTWYGAYEYNTSITGTTTITSFDTSNGSANFQLTVSTTGYYVFSVTWSGQPTLTVRYPDTMVYFYNALGWENVYMHDGWWNDSSASNRGALRGLAMTAGDNNIYSAFVPSESFYRVTFTSEKQVNDGDGQYGAGYDNFYGTNVVWNANHFDSATPLYVPTTTLSEELNNCSYYYGGSWHAYPTYTRTVTSGNFGTICLPFAATVTGATVYKITSKVMNGDNLAGINLESVETLEAGKAYIFKATASELTATFSGAPAEATEAYGMFGNLSSEKMTVPEGNYVVGTDNLIHKVVSGGSGGSGVTVGQYKGYITLNGINAAGARGANFMSFQDETTTSIESISMESQNEVFNLQGQRVENAQKGLFIVNGKKVLVK
ncbi:MAG: hypothetical protein II949_09075 [Prevotella sp.]|nr:hypothetical protein [Prevotella sp.]